MYIKMKNNKKKYYYISIWRYPKANILENSLKKIQNLKDEKLTIYIIQIAEI